ncbi:hypothetical protein DVK03_14225 [Haloferax sp. Atlit-109R]|nr:hypothetical protein C5B88_14215 [Haloferax sp. Atlit-24N]RLM35943.1 hypothetical protein DVK03_14225 [Haloferax sp. Atlit-109R]RLM43793.1 hypothetical protein DVK04_14225 [Haloferax sp. Atlit-105R]
MNDKEAVVEALERAINKVDGYEEYSISKEAASVLDEIESELEALKMKLVEYEGMATYPGDCKYV